MISGGQTGTVRESIIRGITDFCEEAEANRTQDVCRDFCPSVVNDRCQSPPSLPSLPEWSQLPVGAQELIGDTNHLAIEDLDYTAAEARSVYEAVRAGGEIPSPAARTTLPASGRRVPSAEDLAIPPAGGRAGAAGHGHPSPVRENLQVARTCRNTCSGGNRLMLAFSPIGEIQLYSRGETLTGVGTVYSSEDAEAGGRFGGILDLYGIVEKGLFMSFGVEYLFQSDFGDGPLHGTNNLHNFNFVTKFGSITSVHPNSDLLLFFGGKTGYLWSDGDLTVRETEGAVDVSQTVTGFGLGLSGIQRSGDINIGASFEYWWTPSSQAVRGTEPSSTIRIFPAEHGARMALIVGYDILD